MLTKYSIFLKENFDDPYDEEVNEDDIINIGDEIILINDLEAHWKMTPHWGNYGDDSFVTAIHNNIGDNLGEVSEFLTRGGFPCVRTRNFNTYKLSCVRKKI